MARASWFRYGVAALFVSLLASLPAAARADVVARISLSSQEMTVYVDGVARYGWAVSTARRGYRTPVGSFRPTRMHKMWYSKKYDNAPMPNAVFFRGGYAVHGTYSVGSLGRPASHGCVRLAPGNAALLYSMVQKQGMSRTRVVINGGGGGLFGGGGGGPFGDIFGDSGGKPRQAPRVLENIGNGMNSFGNWVANTVNDATSR